MKRFIQRFWNFVLALSALIGIIYIPADIFGLVETYPWVGSVAAMFDRFTAIATFSAILIFYILWIDIRPFVLNWWKNKFSSDGSLYEAFLVDSNIHCETMRIETENDQPPIYANIFYLLIGNALTTGKALNNAQARLFLHGAPPVLAIKGTTDAMVDIRHGEWAFFEVGRIISKEAMRPPKGTIDLGTQLQSYLHNVPRCYLTFEIQSFEKISSYNLSSSSNGHHIWEVFVVVSADDVLAKNVKLSIDLTKDNNPVSLALMS